MKSFQRILFATDFSRASERALEAAFELAKENGAELLVAHAYQLPAMLPTDISVSPAIYDELDTSLREGVRKRLETIVEEAHEQGINARPLILSGSPYDAIADAAREDKADLLVLGTHGRTGAPRFLLGSVASRVISTAPCPVMTVRTA
jgi:universal stress protein A